MEWKRKLGGREKENLFASEQEVTTAIAVIQSEALEHGCCCPWCWSEAGRNSWNCPVSWLKRPRWQPSHLGSASIFSSASGGSKNMQNTVTLMFLFLTWFIWPIRATLKESIVGQIDHHGALFWRFLAYHHKSTTEIFAMNHILRHSHPVSCFKGFFYLHCGLCAMHFGPFFFFLPQYLKWPLVKMSTLLYCQPRI